jgi:predicted dehydrogenase
VKDALGVAVVGFGWMGEVHARAFARLPHHYPASPLRPRLVAVADPVEDRRAQALSAYGFARGSADWRDVVADPEVQVVSICGPNFSHREIAVAAAEAGKHVWVEKPAGRDLADTEAIAEAIGRAGVRSAVGFNYRNAPALEEARRIVSSGGIGRVESVSVVLTSDYAAHPDGALSWRFDPAYAGTGVLGDLASHGFDLLRYVVGPSEGEVAELVADTATFITSRPQAGAEAVSHFATATGGELGPVGNEDYASVMMRLQSKARAHLETSRVAVGEQCHYGIEVRGTAGAVAWDFRRLQELRVCVGTAYQNVAWETRFVGPGAGELSAFQPGAGVSMGYDDLKVVECARLVEAIADGADRGATIADGVAAARLVDAVLASTDKRGWIAVHHG